MAGNNVIDVGDVEEETDDEDEFISVQHHTVPARCGHISQCIGMNVLVWGGYQDNPDDRYLPPKNLWVYNLDLEIWRCYKTKGEIPPGMSGCCSCIYDGCLYIIAGHSDIGNLDTIYKLNLKHLTWSRVIPIGDLMSPRDKSTSWCYQNKIYVFGGFGVPTKEYLHEHGNFEFDPTLQTLPLRNRGWNNQVMVFDIKNETWSNPKCKGVVPQPRAAHGTARIGDNVFLFGGRYLYSRLNDLHCLNLSSLTWSGELNTSSNVPCGRSWHTFTTISDTFLFLYGGFTQHQIPLSDAWILDVNTLQWTQLNVPVNRPRLWHSACSSQQGDLIIFGGCANDILDQRVPTVHSSDIICFRVSPKTLQRLCLEAVFNMREKTQSSWDTLPYTIKYMLNNKVKYTNMKTVDIKKENRFPSTEISRHTTCAVS